MAAPPLEFLTSYIWMFTTVLAIIAGIVAFILYKYWWLPPISRTMAKVKHSRGVAAFIETDDGVIELHISDKQFPEGVIHNKRGWFLLPKRPYTSEEEPKRGPGRPPKNADSGAPDAEKPKSEKLKALFTREKEKKETEQTMEMVLHVPVLQGLGKQVFFGSTTAAGLAGLKAIAHADLRKVRELAPSMYQKTQLDALATGSRFEGMRMASREAVKIIVYALAAGTVIACVGLVVYLLTSRPAPAAQVASALLGFLL